jgi:MFS transporter, putative metabolite transport protein
VDGGFLRRLTAATALGEGLDGYDLGAISIVLPTITAQLGLSATVTGLVGASTLIGIFIGAPGVGYLTDRFGRRTLFLADITSFIVFGALQLAVTNAGELLAVRLLLGISIGAEYSIGAAMLAELSPSAGRGRRLAWLQTCWYSGYVIAVATAYLFRDTLHLSWREVLATSTLPAIATLLLRRGLPESPRWLISQGRDEEAREIVERHLGSDYAEGEQLADEPTRGGGWRELFTPDMRRRTAFTSIFWAANVAPYFAIFTFAPTVFSSLGIHDVVVVTISENVVAALGALAGQLLVERTGRRPMVIVCFWVTAAMLVVVGGWSLAPGAVVVACFAVFSLFNAAQGDLTGIYPPEVFPSEIRSTGVGFSAAVSRIGAAAGTFLLPIGISTIGISASVLIGAGICVAGAAVSHLWAPETTGRSLSTTARHDARTGPEVATAASG